MITPQAKIDLYIHGAGFPSDRWEHLYNKGVTIAHLTGFCSHTHGCEMASQNYLDRIFDGITGVAPRKCTCGLHDILAKALAEEEKNLGINR